MTTETPAKAKPEPRSKPASKASVSAAVEKADEAAAPPAAGPLRLKALVDRVTASTGGKKKGVKEIVEATLTQLGLALQNGEMLNLPEFGRVRVAKMQGAGSGSAMTLKMRRGQDGTAKSGGPKKKSGEEALAEPADQS